MSDDETAWWNGSHVNAGEEERGKKLQLPPSANKMPELVDLYLNNPTDPPTQMCHFDVLLPVWMLACPAVRKISVLCSGSDAPAISLVFLIEGVKEEDLYTSLLPNNTDVNSCFLCYFHFDSNTQISKSSKPDIPRVYFSFCFVDVAKFPELWYLHLFFFYMR